MRGRLKALVCGLAATAGVSASADVIYKSTDAAGHATYSDRPQSPIAQAIVVKTVRAEPDAAQARIAAEGAEIAASEQARKAKAEADRASRAQKEQVERAKRTRCEQAQSRVRRLTNERLVFSYNAQGERVYPSNKELEAQRSNAREEEEQYCD